MIHPEAAWAQGATGQGIKVAILDDGVINTTHDLSGKLTSDSVDVVGSRGQPYASRDQHGTMVAGFIAANFDDRGTVGVAFNAQILSIRADEIGPCGSDAGAPANSDCGFFGSDIARGIDYATAHGARVLNMSLGGDSPSGSATQAALLRAVGAGQVIVAAAGNAENGATPAANPGWPARFATDPAFNGQMIAVGALNSTGTDIASFSYRAGVTQNFYILAPGENVWSGCGLPASSGTGTVCYRGSGTSFATPHVSGAAALLMSGFPNLSAKDVVDILLRTARDMGAPGVDAIYGHGALDIQRAFAPVGSLSLPTTAGEVVISDDAGPGAAGGLALGDALSRAEGLKTVGYDEYRRMFRLNLGDSYHPLAQRSLAGSLPALSQGAIELKTPDGAQFRIAALSNPEAQQRPSGIDGLRETHDGLLNVSADYAKGAVRFGLWAGQSGAAPTFDGEPVDDFSAMAGAETAARAGYAVGRWTFSAEGGAGKRSLSDDFAMIGADRASEQLGSHYARLLANFKDRYLSTTLGFGQLDEKGGPLGTIAPSHSDLSMPATSRFFTARTEWDRIPGLTLSVEGAVGRTDAEGRLLALHDAVSSSWRLRGVADCGRFGLPCQGLAIELAQPVRLERGSITTRLADQPADYFDPITYSDRKLDLSPSGRELDLRVSSWQPLGPGELRFEAMAISNEGHRADAPLNVGVTAGWRAAF